MLECVDARTHERTDAGSSPILKNAVCHKKYRFQSFLSIQYVHGDLGKHLGKGSSTDRTHIIRTE